MLCVGNVYFSVLNDKFRLSLHLPVDSVSMFDTCYLVPSGGDSSLSSQPEEPSALGKLSPLPPPCLLSL